MLSAGSETRIGGVSSGGESKRGLTLAARFSPPPPSPCLLFSSLLFSSLLFSSLLFSSHFPPSRYNICPKAIAEGGGIGEKFSKMLTSSMDVFPIRLTLHEVIHILGGIGPQGHTSNSTWRTRFNHVLGKNETLLRTPRVLAKWREQTGCADSEGPPVEDYPSGHGHWESRVFGPEVMSYGWATGEPYLSVR